MDHILVVDDDHNLLSVIRMRLEAADYKVFTASDSTDTLQTVRSQEIDLALVDLKLAAEDGITLMEELHRLHTDLPVIILTAHGSIGTAVE